MGEEPRIARAGWASASSCRIADDHSGINAEVALASDSDQQVASPQHNLGNVGQSDSHGLSSSHVILRHETHGYRLIRRQFNAPTSDRPPFPCRASNASNSSGGTGLEYR